MIAFYGASTQFYGECVAINYWLCWLFESWDKRR
jgi:hypothetical protein